MSITSFFLCWLFDSLPHISFFIHSIITTAHLFCVLHAHFFCFPFFYLPFASLSPILSLSSLSSLSHIHFFLFSTNHTARHPPIHPYCPLHQWTCLVDSSIMKRNSTIQPTSGTPHLSFAAAASKPPSTPTPTPPPQTTTTQTTQTSHTPSVTKPSSSPVPNTTIAASASTTTPSFIPSKAGPTPPASVSSNSQPQSPARASPIPSTTNGNYSAVAAKANNA